MISLQLCFGAAAARLLGEELTPLESVLLQLLLDPFPLLGVPREAPANLLGEVRRALVRLFRDLRPGRSRLRDHLAVPPSLEIPLHDPEHDLPAQRLEVDGGFRLAGGDPVLGDEPLPRAMGQEGELPQALPFLRVGEDLVDDLELLLQRDALRKLRSVLEDALLRAGRLLGELVDHLQQPVPLGPLGSAFLAGDHRGDLPGLLPIEHLDRLHRLREHLVQRRRRRLVQGRPPQLLAVLPLRVGEPVVFLGGLLELVRGEQRPGLGKRPGQFRLVLDAQHLGARVQLLDLRHRHRQRRARLDGSGNPAVGLRLGRHLAGGVGGGEPGLEEDHFPVLVGAGVEQLLAVLAQLCEELLPLRGELLRLGVELLGVSRGEAVDDGGDRALELVAALQVAFQHAHAQGPQLLDHVIAEDAKRLGGVAGDQHALALGEQVTDQVGDGVGLPGSRRPLDEYASLALEPHGDPDLLRVGGLAEQHLLRLVAWLEGLRLLVRLGRRVQTDDLEQRQGEILASGQIVERSLDRGGEAQGAGAEEQHLGAADLRVLRFLRRWLFGELPARRKLHDEAPEELDRLGAAQGMESAPIQLLAAARQHLGLDVRHGPEQRRIELHLPARLDEGELGDAGVEGELDALEQDGMVDAALQPLPAQDSVAQHQLDVLGLALDPAVELVELLEGLHRGARWTLGAGPGLVLGAPALVRFDAAGLRIEPDGLGARVPLRLHQHDLAVGVLPVAL